MEKNRRHTLNAAPVLFTVFYFLFAGLLLTLLYLLVPPVDVRYYIGGTLLLIVLALLGWAYFIVFLSIPQNMVRAFDDLKNRVFAGELNTIDQFAGEFSLFLPRFFDYAFFDIAYAAMMTPEGHLFCSAEKIREQAGWKEIERQAQETEDLFYTGRVKPGSKRYYVYTIPMYLNKKYLGALTVFSRQRLGPLKRKILKNLEDYFLDDLLFHLENKRNT